MSGRGLCIVIGGARDELAIGHRRIIIHVAAGFIVISDGVAFLLSLIHISEPTRPY